MDSIKVRDAAIGLRHFRRFHDWLCDMDIVYKREVETLALNMRLDDYISVENFHDKTLDLMANSLCDNDFHFLFRDRRDAIREADGDEA